MFPGQRQMEDSIMKQVSCLSKIIHTGRRCELCDHGETNFYPLSNFHLDRDPTNEDPTNLALICPPCYRHLLMAMPQGIAHSLTLFAFLINRKLYRSDQLTGRPTPVQNLSGPQGEIPYPTI